MPVTSDIFGKTLQEVQQPFTADRALLLINDKVVGAALTVSISYGQAITKRRTIGGKQAIIYSGQPEGNIQIQRLVTFQSVPGQESSGLPEYGTGIWNICEPADIKFELTGGNCGDQTFSFIATGAIIQQYAITAEAEGTTIADSIVISFLQLLPGA